MDRSNLLSTSLGYLNTFYRHKFKAIFAFLCVVGLSVLAAFFLPKTYRSEGVLFVRLGRENATLDSTAIPGQKPIVALPSSRESEINSLVEVLDSRIITEQVVDALGPTAILKPSTITALSPPTGPVDLANRDLQNRSDVLGAESELTNSESADKSVSAANRVTPVRPSEAYLKQRDDAIRKLSQCVSAEPAHRSTVIRVVCKGPSPVWCQAVAAKMIDVFVAQHIRLTRAPGSLKFFSDQTKRLSGELKAKEVQLRDLMSTTGIASPEQQRKALVLRMNELQDELAKAERNLVVARSKLQKLENQLDQLPEDEVASLVDGRSDPGVDLMRDELYRLQLMKEEAAARYTKDHPLMKKAELQLAEAIRIMAREKPTRTETTKAKSHLYEQTKLTVLQAQTDIASFEAEADKLKSQLVDARRELTSFNSDELEIRRMQRDVDVLQADYETYAASVERGRVDQALDAQRMSSISVAQPASLELRAIAPRKSIILALGLIAGFLSAVGVVLIADLVSPHIESPEDAPRATGSPGVGAGSEMRTEALVTEGSHFA